MAPARHGADIESKQVGNLGVPTPARLQGFQPCVEASLFLVEQAEEQHDSRAQLIGHDVGLWQRASRAQAGA